MTSLTSSDFSEFFSGVHGYPPHPWQSRLAAQVCGEGWPELLDLPTGAGKTAALDIAVFALACDPANQPRRVVFVVDRRLIVDQVSERATTIRQALVEHQDDDSVLGTVADRLRGLSAASTILGTSTLRGGLSDNEWARYPDAPWVISSTVDQVGSRLLFRGYGVSSAMQPIHAGMLGNDALFLLDEVHLSQPFAHTLNEIRTHHRPETTVARPWHVVEMSATPANKDQPRFRLADEDRAPGSHLQRILAATKTARLETVGPKRAKEGENAIANDAVRLIEQLGEPDSVGFVVNRVATARAVAAVLANGGFRPLLLTGRMRPFDRVAVLNDPSFLAVQNNTETAHPDAPADVPIVVATQTIEVGADLDFGAMVTECAPIDSLRQRFGRLDRSGRRAADDRPVNATIVLPAAVAASRKELSDPVYGDGRLQRAWKWLGDQADLETGTLDVGVESEHLANPPIDVRTDRETGPLLLDSHMDAFIQTSPSPVYGSEVHRWLHGDADVDTDVSIVWRSDINEDVIKRLKEQPSTELEQRTADYLSVAPIDAAEQLAVPLRAAQRWLRQYAPSEVADVSARVEEDERRSSEGSGRTALRFAKRQLTPIIASDLAPGDTIVVPANWGGIENGTWAPESTTKVTDVGGLSSDLDETISIRLLGEWFANLPQLSEVDHDAGNDPQQIVKDWFDLLPDPADEANNAATASWQRLSSLLEGRIEVVSCSIHPSSANFAVRTKNCRPMLLFDGSDEANSSTGTAVELTAHLEGVGARARAYAKHMGLPESLCSDLELAGTLHDLGKLDPRFQIRLRGGDVLAAAMATSPLAKSASGFGTGSRVLRDEDRYPRGLRHELLSVTLMDRYPELASKANHSDLVRYLVASHHGHHRPFVPAQVDPDPAAVVGRVFGIEIDTTAALSPEVHDLRTGDLFWRLVEEWGHYGLAWFEAVFRLADHRQSEAEASNE